MSSPIGSQHKIKMLLFSSTSPIAKLLWRETINTTTLRFIVKKKSIKYMQQSQSSLGGKENWDVAKTGKEMSKECY